MQCYRTDKARFPMCFGYKKKTIYTSVGGKSGQRLTRTYVAIYKRKR